MTAQAIGELRGFAVVLDRKGMSLTAEQLRHVCDCAQLYRAVEIDPRLENLYPGPSLELAKRRLAETTETQTIEAIGKLRLHTALGGPFYLEIRHLCDCAQVHRAESHEAIGQMPIAESMQILTRKFGLGTAFSSLLDNLRQDETPTVDWPLRQRLLDVIANYVPESEPLVDGSSAPQAESGLDDMLDDATEEERLSDAVRDEDAATYGDNVMAEAGREGALEDAIEREVADEWAPQDPEDAVRDRDDDED